MIFDCHADVLVDVTDKRLQGKTDVLKTYHMEKYRNSGVDASIFVLWGRPTQDEEANKKRLEDLLREGIKELEENSDIVQIVYKVEDFYTAQSQGKLAVMIGVEGLCGIGENLDMIDELYKKGVRHTSLTWNEENAFATGAKGSTGRGMTPLGVTVVEKLEELGIVVDVSHLNDASFWDLMQIVKKPIIASHSNSRSLCPVPRNLTDEQILAIGKNGGVIGINAIREFNAVEVKDQTAKSLANHVDYIVKLVGIDHVGFGFDFCDMLDEDNDYNPDVDHDRDYEMYDLKGVKIFLEELEKRGYKGEELEKIKYKNFMRVFGEILR